MVRVFEAGFAKVELPLLPDWSGTLSSLLFFFLQSAFEELPQKITMFSLLTCFSLQPLTLESEWAAGKPHPSQ